MINSIAVSTIAMIKKALSTGIHFGKAISAMSGPSAMTDNTKNEIKSGNYERF